MKKLLISAFAAALLSLAAIPAAAGTMSGKMVHGMMMPTCAAGDTIVGVNTQTNMYMTHAQMKAKMKGMSKDQIHAAMVKNHVKPMCMSKAKAMGAKPMSTKM